MHSSVKNKAMATMLLTFVYDWLDENQARRRRHDCLDIVRSEMKFVGGNQNLPPILAALSGKITCFAFEHLRAQYALSHGYQSTITDELDEYGCAYYSVEKVALHEVVRPIVYDYNKEQDGQIGEKTFQDCEVDFGLADTARKRKTSLRTCSCQLPNCFLMPCRHILHLHTILQIHTMDIEFFHTKWHKTTEEDLRNKIMLSKSLYSRKQKRNTAYEERDESTQKRTTKERYNIVLDSLRPVAEFAQSSDQLMEKVLIAVDAFVKQTMYNLNADSSHKRFRQMSDTTTSGIEFAAACATNIALGPDRSALLAAMGSEWKQVGACPIIKHLSNKSGNTRTFMIGKSIFYKWADKNKQGWHRGTVVAICDKEDQSFNFSVKFHTDGSVVACNLFQDTYLHRTMSEPVKKHTWVLVEARSLGETNLSSVQAPQHKPRMGRPQTKRFKPLCGPTS